MLPLGVKKRPFAVEPVTGLMLPDGIFDTAIRRLLISAYIVNLSSDTVGHFWARIHDNSDYRITGIDQVHVDTDLTSGASTLVQWEVTFSEAKPGKKKLQIEFGGMSFDVQGKPSYWDGYVETVYFLSATTYSESDGRYICSIPEGTLDMYFENSAQAPSTRPLNSELPIPAIQFPERFIGGVNPIGLNIPFDDPWWKVVAWIIAAVAAIGAIVAAKEGKGAASIGVSGHNHDDPYKHDWCVPDPTAMGQDNRFTPAGILSAIANGAILVGLSDEIDPWERGRVAAALQPGEIPVRETVSVELSYPDEIIAGTNFAIDVRWTYKSELSNGRSTNLAVEETQRNTHVADWEFNAPKEVIEGDPIVVKVRGKRGSGSYFRGDEIYGFAVFIAPDGQASFRVPILDDGRGYDEVAGDGWFTAAIALSEIMEGRELDPIGEWRVQFVVQDVNDATPEMEPKVAATHIGGALLLAPLAASKSSAGVCSMIDAVLVWVRKKSE